MAHKKGQGSSRNGRDSNAKRLGVKVSDGQSILAGGIIIKQRGTRYHPGRNVKRGNGKLRSKIVRYFINTIFFMKSMSISI